MILNPLLDSFKYKNIPSEKEVLKGFKFQTLSTTYMKYLNSGDTTGLKNFVDSMPTEKLKEFFKAAQDNEKILINSDSLTTWLANTEASMNSFSSRFSGVGNALKSTISGIASSFANFGVMAIADFAISGVISLVDNLIHKNERLIEAGKEAQQAISNTFSEYSQKSQVVSSTAAKYDQLSKGVNTFTNQNVSLSTSEYSEFLDISNQLANTFPSLVSGYDTQGNALLRLGTGAQSASDQLNTLLSIQRRSANMDISNNLSTNFEGALAQAEVIAEKKLDIEKQLENYIPTMSETSPLPPLAHFTFDNSLVDQSDLQQELQQFLDDNGTDYQITNFTAADGFSNAQSYDIVLPSSLKDEVEAMIYKQQELLADSSNPLRQQLDAYELQLKENWAAMTGSISSFLQTSDSFSNLEAPIQNALLTNLQDLSTADISNIQDQYSGDIKAFLYTEYLQPMADLTPEAQNRLSSLFSIDPKNMRLDEYSRLVNNALSAAFPNNNAMQESYAKKFGLSTYLEKEQVKLYDLTSHLKSNIVDGNTSESDIETKLSAMSIGDREIAYELVVEKGQAFETLNQLKEAIAKIKADTKSSDTFQQFFNTQEALNKAMSEQASQGYISQSTADALTDSNSAYAVCLEKSATGLQLNAQLASSLSQNQADLNLTLARTQKELAQADYESNIEKIKDFAQNAEELQKILDGTYEGTVPDDILNLVTQNEALQAQIDMYSDLENQILGTTSALQLYKEAQGTPNASDNYNTIVAGKDAADKLYKEGWTNKDDFTTYAMLLGNNGDSVEDAVNNYKANSAKYSEWLTGDTEGLKKWIDYCTEESQKLGENFVELGENGTEFNIDNISQFADAMGMTTEMAQYFLIALQDMGYQLDSSLYTDNIQDSFNNFDTSAENAVAQANSLTSQLQYLSENGIDVSGLVEQLNTIRESLGMERIDPITLKVEAKTSNPDQPKQEVENAGAAQVPVEASADPEQVNETVTTAASGAEAEVELTANTEDVPETFKAIDRDVNYKPHTNELPEFFSPITRIVYYKKVAEGESPKPTGKGTTPSGTQWVGIGPLGGIADGNVHIARSTGSLGESRSVHALTGELGPELIVRGSRYFTVGDYGPEMVHLKQGDIVFNHRQTHDILTKGYASGRGRALASGNAFASGMALADGNSDSSEKADTTIDWIERLTKSLERLFDALKSYAEDLYQTYQNQNAAIDTALSKGNKDVKTFRDASVYYTKKASSVGLDNNLQKKVREGQLFIEDIEDEDLRKKIKEFQDFYEKAQDCSDKARELQLELIELNKAKLDNIEDDFDNLISYQEKLISNQKSFLDLQKAKGESASASDYDGMIDAQNQIIAYLNGKRQELQSQFDSLVGSGVLVENTDDWLKWKENISSIQKDLNNARSDIEDLNDSIRDIRWQGFNDGIDKLDSLNDELDFLSDKIEDSALFSEDGKLTAAGSTKIALLSMQMVNARTKVADYDMAIKALDRELANGVISQSQYNEELGKYKEQQRKASNELSKYKKAVIDVVKEGIDKQTDAMEKYIKAQKEAISQEERYEDYLERVNETQKQINSIRAQLASMSGDDSNATKAKRQSLNDELLELEDKLAKEQKDHKTDMLKEAYDEELDAFKEKADKEKELLDTDLTAQSEAIAGMLAGAQDNYAAVYEELGSMAEAYGIHLSSELSDPWKNAITAIETYKKAAAAAAETAAAQSAVGSNVADINTDAQKQATNNSASVPPAKETAAAKAGGQWKKNNTGWWYEHDGGSYTKNGWEQVDGKWYHFDGKGYMQKGWIKDGQTWYYLNPGGDMAVNKWMKAANGKDWYYLGSDGKMVENGMINSKGKDYYMAAGGKMRTGWFKLGATWYYANASGAIQKNQWVKGANGKDWYYVGPDGVMYANMNAVIDGKNSRFDGNGRWLGYFARGARDISSLTGYGVIGEGGRDELVATKGGQLVRLDDAKMIFSNEQTKRLWELSQLSAPLSLSASQNLLPASALSAQRAVNVSQTFGSLITVEGNVTKDALPGLEKIMDQKLKSFEKNMYQGLQSLTGLKR